jgi:hypothetical protein
MTDARRHRGRPPKFDCARRPVTTTLPESTLLQLESIDSDRALAIAKAASVATRKDSSRSASVELLEAFPGHAVVVVGPSKNLRKIEWLRMVEISPSRFLLGVPTGTPTEVLEVAVTDLLEHLPARETYERDLLAELHRILSHRRRRKDVFKAEIVLLRIK